MTHVRPVLAAALLGVSVAACTNGPPPRTHYTPASFAGEPVFSFNVARIEVVDEYRSPGTAPHIESTMPVSPEAGIRQWAHDRLRAAGSTGTLRVLIRDSAATETPLPIDTTLSSEFKKQEVARLDMRLDVALQILDDRQYVQAEVVQKNNVSQTELEGMTLNAKDKLDYDLVTQMTTAFDRGIDPTIRDTLGRNLIAP